jgi:hypothetical protein
MKKRAGVFGHGHRFTGGGMDEFEVVRCKESEGWQGDCSPGCENQCWSDPDRVMLVKLPVHGEHA